MARKPCSFEEVQSDWHQKGRKEGYATGGRSKQEIANERESIINKLRWTAYGVDAATAGAGTIGLTDGEHTKWLNRQRLRNCHRISATVYPGCLKYPAKREGSGVPDAPFNSKWHELAMKRMLRYASENGYDRLPGRRETQQVERYRKRCGKWSIRFLEAMG